MTTEEQIAEWEQQGDAVALACELRRLRRLLRRLEFDFRTERVNRNDEDRIALFHEALPDESDLPAIESLRGILS